MSEDSTRPRHGFQVAVIALLSTLLLAWFCVIRMLWNDWRIDPQYSYGMLVPLLVFGLLVKRSEDSSGPSASDAKGSLIGGAGMILAALVLALVVPVAEANPDWRPLGLLASIAAVILTLCLLYLSGGWNWLRHYAFPVCFFLIAVPWPRNLEQSVMNGLTSWNAGATLEILHWLGYEAMRRGNLIMIPAGVLGIEEACSGIRSLQSGLMVALFFGEIFRLTALRRVLLLATALIAALIGNILRSSFLAVMASREGLSAVAKWHDPAGIIVLLVTFGSVFVSALVWRSRNAPASPGVELINPTPVRPPLLAFVPAILLFISLTGTECWYRSHEADLGKWNAWSLHRREGVPGVARVEVPHATLKMMYYPEGFSEKWSGPGGVGGQAFYFRWPPGRTSLQAVSMHNPEVCLGSIGMKMKAPLSSSTYDRNGISIPFRSWLFEQNGRPVYVFQAMVSDGDRYHTGLDFPYDSLFGRLRVVIEGKRNRGQRMVEVAFWNMPDESAAREGLREYLNQTLTADHTSDPMHSNTP
jgi:exosortase